jgi:hypothetical protein
MVRRRPERLLPKGEPLAPPNFSAGSPRRFAGSPICWQPSADSNAPTARSPIFERLESHHPPRAGRRLRTSRSRKCASHLALLLGQCSATMTTSTRTGQGRPLRPRSLQNGASRAENGPVQWSDISLPLRDNVDMPVPSHYSAAPSGDLCTTYKSQFVVWGESRRSVSITDERPQPPRPGLRLRSRRSTSVRVLAMECSSATDCALELRATAAIDAGATAGSSPKNVGGEQMKHDIVDTERQRDAGKVRVVQLDLAGMLRGSKRRDEHSSYCWLRSPVAGRASLGDGLPRNSFFT